MNKPFHKPSVKKPPHVKKFSTQRYSSLCRDSKCPTIWMLVYCGAGTSLGPQLGTSRLYGRPAFGLTPSEPWGPSLRPLGSSCPSVNSIHSWVFTITALGAVVLSKELFPFITSNHTLISDLINGHFTYRWVIICGWSFSDGTYQSSHCDHPASDGLLLVSHSLSFQ